MNIVSSVLGLAHNLCFIIIGIFGIGFLIGFHELGHFLFCKLFSIRTPSFSIGMGPQLFSKKIGETEFVLSAIPVGGYVEIAGSAELGQGEQKEAYRDDEHSFANKPYIQKMLVMLGGILFNLFFGYVALSLLFFLGIPKSPLLYPVYASHTIAVVDPNSPAAKSGLQSNDIILAVNSINTANALCIFKELKKLPNQSATLTLDRNGQQLILSVPISALEVKKETIGYLEGVDFLIPRYSFLESLKLGFHATYYICYQIGLSFSSMFTEKKFGDVGGPLLIISQTIKSAAKGFKIFLLLLAFISINLALLNIIPLPILDGGQMLYYTIEAIRGRKLSPNIREYIHYITWIGLLIFIVWISIKDFIRIFWPS